MAHRRAGKTVAVVNDIIERASRNPLPNPRYAYIAPLLRQAKDIAWMYLKEAAAPFSPKISESGLYVELSALPNSPRVTIYGADNPDSFRGLYLDGAALDEYGNMLGSVFSEILLPALIDRRGWAVFMGTPNGPNHFRDLYYSRLDDKDWYVMKLPYWATKVIPEADIAEMKKIMEPEQFAQEMECNFEASVRGAIYAREIEVMEQEGRIGDYMPDPRFPISTVMDLGFRDSTAIGFAQERPDGMLMVHSFADRYRKIDDYIDYIEHFFITRKLKMGDIWLPHDARARTLQTGKSIVDSFLKRRFRPKIVTELDLLDGIAATRMQFPLWFINRSGNKDLILALKSYHRKYDEKLKVYQSEPVHDWSSHYSDMFRYCNISLGRLTPEKFERYTGAQRARYSFSLNDLWEPR